MGHGNFFFLILYSYSTYTEEEKILSDYIEKIISWTMNGWIKWEKTDRVMAILFASASISLLNPQMGHGNFFFLIIVLPLVFLS